MEFLENELYHIYNRGNNKQKIFFKPENYRFFLKKVRKCICPYCDILSWSLMSNHFHLMIHADSRSVQFKTLGGQERNVLSEGFRNLLSSYAQAINKQNDRTGSLFQQNTKSKIISKNDNLYPLTCFHYIHQNPLKAGIVNKIEDWEYTSFMDYCGERNGTLVNKDLAIQLLGLDLENFYEDSYRMVSDENSKRIF